MTDESRSVPRHAAAKARAWDRLYRDNAREGQELNVALMNDYLERALAEEDWP